MKKILSFLLLACLTLSALATTKPQATKSFMQKERLSNTLEVLQQPKAKPVAESTTWTAPTTYSAAKAPAQLTGLDTTEVYFTSFYEDPYFYPADTVVGRNGDTVITPAEWYFVLHNERYQFIFDIINNTKPETMAGTYTEADLEEWYSWCMFPEANGKTHYYKTCELTIQEDKISTTKTKYIVDAVVLATKGIGGEEYGYFKVHAEHTMVKPKERYDVAILNCIIEQEEDRIRIAGQDDTIAVDLTFFTELGVEGYYSHKIMDTENSKLVHRGVEHEIDHLEGIIASAENIFGSISYVFMFEALTSDAIFYNVAMEAPIIPSDTIEIKCYNMVVNDAFGMSHSVIEVSASNGYYDVYAGYNDTKITTPKEYKDGNAYVYLTDFKTGKTIESLLCTLSITGNALKGYQVEIKMLGTDHKYYIMHLVYAVPSVKETKVLNFTEPAKSMFYIDALGSKELQLANYNGEYSVSFDFPFVDQVMDGEFGRAEIFADQTFLTHHKMVDGVVEDINVTFAEIKGKLWQKNDTTYLTSTILGFDSIQYEITMFYAIPKPTETITYTFDGFGDDEVEFTNALSSGIFILDGMSADGNLMAKVNVERLSGKTVEGTFYNDGKFEHTDFYAPDTYVQVYNSATKDYDEYSVQKGTMTVTVVDNVLTAVASFICDNAKQYNLTFKVEYARERIPFDMEDGEMDYTFSNNAEVIYADFIDGYGIVQLIIADEYYAADFYFFTNTLDSNTVVPAGVYPINPSFQEGSVLACKGILPDGPAQSYFCALDADGYLDSNELYCLVDGKVTVENINGKLKLDVDAINSYEVPVMLHYNADTAVENVTVDTTGASKCILNGQLFIIRNGETYNANGALVK